MNAYQYQKQINTPEAQKAIAEGQRLVLLSSVKQGEHLRRKPDAKTTYVRNHYDREPKKYSLSDTEDMNREIFLPGKTLVYVGFTY